ncbi:MAG: FkbM family methyltransferase [Burkholderiaceae bacterium]|nr:FkbM family methyltransferase [Burkholderiaceae bacterium]
MKPTYFAVKARRWLSQQTPKTFVAKFGLLNRFFLQWPVSMELGSSGLTLLAREGGCSVNFCHTGRARRYSKGVGNCLDGLHRSYLLDRVPLRPSDWVLDCGANIGEVSLSLLRREPSLNIVAVEPETLEADCADLNLYEGRPKTVRGVLWHEETTLKFYSAAATADSSTIEPPKYDSVREVPATTVDALLTRMQCQRLRLLKLEAEGAEPEILRGAMGSLERIDYIAADLGPERGVRQEETATPVINLLLARGFEIVGMRFDRVVVLFRNRHATD